MLDEHDESYQQEQAPTWHARDVVAERAARAGARCLLVSPMPTLEAQRLAGGDVLAAGREVERGAWPVCEVVDLRTTSPLDEDTVLESVEGTGRLVVVDEAHPRCNIATDISALVARNAFGSLRAPIEMVTAPHTPVPFAPVLEDLYIPTAQQIAEAVRRTLKGSRR